MKSILKSIHWFAIYRISALIWLGQLCNFWLVSLSQCLTVINFIRMLIKKMGVLNYRMFLHVLSVQITRLINPRWLLKNFLKKKECIKLYLHDSSRFWPGDDYIHKYFGTQNPINHEKIAIFAFNLCYQVFQLNQWLAMFV